MTVFILNPAAGHGRAARFWRRVEPVVRECVSTYRARPTRGPGHAADIVAEELRRGARRFVAVGGDGTLNETAEGLLRLPEAEREGAAVGCLPAGSGCDFARHFGVPADPRKWLPRLAAALPVRIDAGRADYEGLDGRPRRRFFVNIAAFGIAGDVGAAMLRSGKPLGGTVSYLVESLKALLRARPRRLRMKADGRRIEGDYHLVAVSNTSTTGGGMRIAPGADASDGLLDLVTVGALGRCALLRSFPRIYSGTHLGVEGVEASRVRELSAEGDGEVFLNLDGEVDGRLPGRFEVLPGALPALLP